MSVITCHDLSRNFAEVKAVAGVSFSVEAGEFFAFLGPNGAGKSTTVHMLTTLLAPSAGRAEVMGFDVVKNAREVRARIGMVFQEPALDDRLSARENLKIHAALYGTPWSKVRQAVDDALAWASLSDMARRPVRSFSGGMKRRLELCRALMHEPAVLFLDEPTLGLDPQGRQHLWERIDDLRSRGLTVLMTTHNLEDAERCNRVAIIDQGELIALGTPADLKQEVVADAAASLEDVFLELTGRELRDQGATARTRMLNFARKGGEQTR